MNKILDGIKQASDIKKLNIDGLKELAQEIRNDILAVTTKNGGQIKNPKFGLPGQEQYLLVNCRKCLECRQKRANEWAVRCMAEAHNYEHNAFITLTYEKNPITLQKRDLQLFFKRLRKALLGVKIKYFAVGEYGTQRWRPHYHAIIFGYDFPDKYLWSKSKRGNVIYRSNLLEKVWTFGNSQ